MLRNGAESLPHFLSSLNLFNFFRFSACNLIFWTFNYLIKFFAHLSIKGWSALRLTTCKYRAKIKWQNSKWQIIFKYCWFVPFLKKSKTQKWPKLNPSWKMSGNFMLPIFQNVRTKSEFWKSAVQPVNKTLSDLFVAGQIQFLTFMYTSRIFSRFSDIFRSFFE